jgi:hypothetical protein
MIIDLSQGTIVIKVGEETVVEIRLLKKTGSLARLLLKLDSRLSITHHNGLGLAKSHRKHATASIPQA